MIQNNVINSIDDPAFSGLSLKPEGGQREREIRLREHAKACLSLELQVSSPTGHVSDRCVTLIVVIKTVDSENWENKK